jgi:hypothetical protein
MWITGEMITSRRPAYININKMIKPYCSRRSNTGRMLAGKILSSTLLPSSGGNGNKLKIARDKFIINI